MVDVLTFLRTTLRIGLPTELPGTLVAESGIGSHHSILNVEIGLIGGLPTGLDGDDMLQAVTFDPLHQQLGQLFETDEGSIE